MARDNDRFRDRVRPTVQPTQNVRADVPAYAAPAGTAGTTVIVDESMPDLSRAGRISWGAVLAGVAVALTANLVLNLFGLGVGLSTLDPAKVDGSPSMGAFSTMAAFWWVLSSLIAAFIGGYTAARLSGRLTRMSPTTSAWHGLVTWAATLLVTVTLLANAVGGVIGGAANAVGGIATGLGHTAVLGTMAAGPAGPDAPSPSGRTQRQADGIGQGISDGLAMVPPPPGPLGNIMAQVRELSGGSNDPAELRMVTTNSVQALLTSDPAQAEAARQRAVTSLARSANISPAEAQQRIATIEQNYQVAVAQAKQQARDAADVAAKAASAAALLGTLALVLGALAGWLGGLAATPGRRFSINPFIRDERDMDERA